MAPRASKRQRTSETSTPTPNNDIHQAFTTWSINKGVEIKGVAPKKLPGRGLGLVTTKPIKKNDRILFIPEKAMFKPDSKLLKSPQIKSASPHAQLAISAMTQCKGAAAPFSTWQATWPTNHDFEATMPMCWSPSLRTHLPPSIQQPLDRQLQDYERDWTSVQPYCQSQNWAQEDFRYYWMIINSRSFHWKPLSPSTSKQKRNPAPPPGPGTMVMCPFIDYMNHGPTGTSVYVFQRPHGYEVVASRDYPAGTELLATYGPHPNDKLLVHYGFINSHPSSPSDDCPFPCDDDIRLTPLLLPHISSQTQLQLQDVGFLGPYALIPDEETQKWELCFKTQVAVRAVLQSCNEWEYFLQNGEDLGEDFTKSVEEWVRPKLEAYVRDVVEGEIRELEGMEKGGEENAIAVGILKARWGQIRDVVNSFLEEG